MNAVGNTNAPVYGVAAEFQCARDLFVYHHLHPSFRDAVLLPSVEAPFVIDLHLLGYGFC